MSGVNGDKARFHRERKQKIQRRLRNREMLKTLTKPGSASAQSTLKAAEKQA